MLKTIMIILLTGFSELLLGINGPADCFCKIVLQKNFVKDNVQIEAYYLYTPEHGGVFMSPNCSNGTLSGNHNEWFDKKIKHSNRTNTRLKIIVIADVKQESLSRYGMQMRVPILYVRNVISYQLVNRDDWNKLFKNRPTKEPESVIKGGALSHP